MKRPGSAGKVMVITIDGPSGAGKGTLSKALAEYLGWHRLESGALYRALAMLSLEQGVEPDAVGELVELASTLHLEFVNAEILLGGKEIGPRLRTPEVEERASLVSRLAPVRRALIHAQQACRQPPGLVAEGRDMGTVVFPDAQLKIFLTASAAERARRRHQQLKEMGGYATITELLRQNERRDERDCTRKVSPLIPADDAKSIDTTAVSSASVVAQVIELWQLTRSENY